jgi:hypothetical protein
MSMELQAGWVYVADYDERPNKATGGPVGLYAKLLKACSKREPPWFRAYKDGSQWVAYREDCERLKAEMAAATKAESKEVAAGLFSCDQAESACQSLADIAFDLSRLRDVLERLTNAFENVATQPPKAESPAFMTTSAGISSRT